MEITAAVVAVVVAVVAAGVVDGLVMTVVVVVVLVSDGRFDAVARIVVLTLYLIVAVESKASSNQKDKMTKH